MIYLFVLDDSLTSQRFTTRTEQLTKFCKPLQILLLWFYLFYVLGRIFVLFEPYVRFF